MCLVLDAMLVTSVAFLNELFYEWSMQCKCPGAISNIIFLAIYAFIVVVAVLDGENSREM